jgi:uncharacterized protein with HEPN domain
LFPNIPKQKISGMRNRIVHDYGSVNLDIVFYTVKEDFPILAKDLEKILEE